MLLQRSVLPRFSILKTVPPSFFSTSITSSTSSTSITSSTSSSTSTSYSATSNSLLHVHKKGPTTRRFRLTIAYNGLVFHGWQKQGPHPKSGVTFRSIEGQLEESIRPALKQLVRFFPAGRTDAGVHATGQVISFDAMLSPSSPVTSPPSKRLRGELLAMARREVFEKEARSVLVEVNGGTATPDGLAAAFNSVLRPDITIVSCEMAPRNFDPLSCLWKRYCYGIPKHAIDPAIDVRRMQEAAALLVGTHDFKAFQAAGGRVTTVRTIFDCKVRQDGSGAVEITCEGSGFLYKMVRIIAGTLLEIGRGTLAPSVITAMLETKNRRLGGPVAPAEYLTLQHVEYDERP